MWRRYEEEDLNKKEGAAGGQGVGGSEKVLFVSHRLGGGHVLQPVDLAALLRRGLGDLVGDRRAVREGTTIQGIRSGGTNERARSFSFHSDKIPTAKYNEV
jgi:hypothetical protein